MSSQALVVRPSAIFTRFSDVLRNPAHPKHPSIDFDWSGLENYDEDDRAEIKEEVRKQLARLMVRIAEFLIDDGRAKVDGAGLRAFVFAWGALGKLQDLSQVQLAQALGKHKQSVGRVVSLFRDRFGWVGARMHSEAARETYRRREARKRAAVTAEGGE